MREKYKGPISNLRLTLAKLTWGETLSMDLWSSIDGSVCPFSLGLSSPPIPRPILYCCSCKKTKKNASANCQDYCSTFPSGLLESPTTFPVLMKTYGWLMRRTFQLSSLDRGLMLQVCSLPGSNDIQSVAKVRSFEF